MSKINVKDLREDLAKKKISQKDISTVVSILTSEKKAKAFEKAVDKKKAVRKVDERIQKVKDENEKRLKKVQDDMKEIIDVIEKDVYTEQVKEVLDFLEIEIVEEKIEESKPSYQSQDFQNFQR